MILLFRIFKALSIPNRERWSAKILREGIPQQFITCNMSFVTCHMSCFMCHVSGVMCHVPSGPILSLSQNVRMSVCLSHCLTNNTTSDGPSAILRPLYHRYFYNFTIEKWSQIYTRTIRKCFFENILFLGTFPIVNPIVNSISNLDHEGVDLSC